MKCNHKDCGSPVKYGLAQRETWLIKDKDADVDEEIWEDEEELSESVVYFCEEHQDEAEITKKDYLYPRESVIDSFKKTISEINEEIEQITQDNDKLANEAMYIPEVKFLLGRVDSYEKALNILEMTK